METYGRWPLVAAAAVVPVTAAVAAGARGPRQVIWAGLPALLAHQTEEWVWPGGFLPYANRRVLGSDRDDFPLTPRDGAVINVALGWAVSAAAPVNPLAAGMSLGIMAGNIAMHVGGGVARREYNPGLATAVAVFAPLAVAQARVLRQAPRPTVIGAVAGAAAVGSIFARCRARLRNADPRPSSRSV